MAATAVMQALDTDGDGELSEKEIENATAALQALDKDKNGKLTAEELRPSFGGRGPGQGPGPGPDAAGTRALVAQLMTFDKNGDGKLAREELPERMQVLMERADANKDGFVDRAELTVFAERAIRLIPGPGERGEPRRRSRPPQAPPSNTDA